MSSWLPKTDEGGGKRCGRSGCPTDEPQCPTGPSRHWKDTLDKLIVVGLGATADCHNVAGLRPTFVASVAHHHTGTHTAGPN